MLIIGIDNGLKGGLVALDSKGKVANWLVMPTREHLGRNRVDAIGLVVWLRGLGGIRHVCYERPVGSKSARAGASMADSFAVVDTTLAILDIPRTPVAAAKWQRSLGVYGGTKKAAIDRAAQIWPQETWLATKRSRVPHDGLVDAALIAYWHLGQG